MVAADRRTHRWLGSLVVTALDSRLDGCEFDSRPPRCPVTTLGKLFTPMYLCRLWWSSGIACMAAV